MSSLIQSVTNGIVEDTSRDVKEKSSGNSLGKDAFLQLLCTQLQYQDPMNPQSDTEFVAQLAQYSQLEELQNLTSMNENQQALGLVGKNVILQVANSSSTSGKIHLSGTVDYVTYVNGKAKLSVGGTLYSLDDLYSVIDETYMIKQGLPGVDKEVETTFDKSNPADVSFEVNLGKEDTIASQVAVLINGKVVDSSHVKLNGTTLTISKDVFKDLDEGTYKPTVIFNDYFVTTVSDKVTIHVKNKVDKTDESTGKAEGTTGGTQGTTGTTGNTEGTTGSTAGSADAGNNVAKNSTNKDQSEISDKQIQALLA